MSSHYHAGAREICYRPSALGNWSHPEHLDPAKRPTPTHEHLKNRKPTHPIVNEFGHMVNRKAGSTKHFKQRPDAGTHGATLVRWPQGNAIIPAAPKATFGYKGIPTQTGFSNTISMPAECRFSSTR
mmetsp:Transcript_57945/g.131301  ORF Transcript_57945/g.131301 Transcript_57945/m.131301 type:complete len:127 (-) Transcript_57945:232-612(-)